MGASPTVVVVNTVAASTTLQFIQFERATQFLCFYDDTCSVDWFGNGLIFVGEEASSLSLMLKYWI